MAKVIKKVRVFLSEQEVTVEGVTRLENGDKFLVIHYVDPDTRFDDVTTGEACFRQECVEGYAVETTTEADTEGVDRH